MKKVTLGTKLGDEYFRMYEMMIVSMVMCYVLKLSIKEKVDIREIMLNVMHQLDTCLGWKED